VYTDIEQYERACECDNQHGEQASHCASVKLAAARSYLSDVPKFSNNSARQLVLVVLLYGLLVDCVSRRNSVFAKLL
jgi:hypothetical protein